MMKRRWFGILSLSLVLAAAAAAQMPEGYLDIFTAKVKPDKRAAFDALVKQMVETNRKHQGSHWLTTEIVYGEHNTVYFTGSRRNYAEIEQGTGFFVGALIKGLGPAGAARLFQDFDNCLISSRAELRRRRWDLSSNPPADNAARARLVGASRWGRTTITRVRPGRQGDYVAQLRAIKAASEKGNRGVTTFVSQSAGGQQGAVFYSAQFRSSLAGFDSPGTPLPQLLGEEGDQKFIKTVGETVLGTETIMTRFLPELSNPTDDIVAVAPEFWRPKPAAPPKPKGKAAAPAPTQ